MGKKTNGLSAGLRKPLPLLLKSAGAELMLMLTPPLPLPQPKRLAFILIKYLDLRV